MKLKPGQQFNPYRLFTGVFIPNAIVRSTKLTSTEKLVLGRLFQYAGANGQAFPHQVTLAQDVGIKRRQVIYILQHLCKLGLIAITPPSGTGRLMHRGNSYVFLWHSMYTAPKPCSECSRVHPRSVQPVAPPTEENQLEENAIASPTATRCASLHDFTDAFCRLWRRQYGAKYPFSKKDGVLANQIWRYLGFNLQYAKRVLRVYFADHSAFFQGHPMGKLRSSLPEFIARERLNAPCNLADVARDSLREIVRTNPDADRNGFARVLKGAIEWRRRCIENLAEAVADLERQREREFRNTGKRSTSMADPSSEIIDALRPSGGSMVNYYYARWIADQVSSWEGWSGRFDGFEVGGKHWRRFLWDWWKRCGRTPNKAERKVIDAAQEG